MVTGGCSKAKRVAVFKNVNILRYMGPNSPREFGRSEKDILCTFFYELNSYNTGEEVIEEIIALAQKITVAGHNFNELTPSDIEFVKCCGRTCRVPQTVPGFEWSMEAIKSLAGQGDIYIRLVHPLECVQVE